MGRPSKQLRNQQKQCAKCKCWKQLSAFAVNRRSSDGHTSYCRECARLKRRASYLRNRSQQLGDAKTYYKRNRTHILQREKAFRQNHRERLRAYHREWYTQHREQVNQQAQERYARNREHQLEVGRNGGSCGRPSANPVPLLASIKTRRLASWS